MRVVIHIGLHKTGSSALQAFLHRNEEQLRRNGFYYRPTLPSFPNHNPLAVAFKKSNRTKKGPAALARMLAAANRRGLRNFLERERTIHTALISAEMLCESDTDVDRFMRELRGHEVRILAYIRHPCDMVISAFNERVRHFESNITRGINELPYAYDISYLSQLNDWMDRDDLTLTLAPYDRAQWQGGSLFHDFLAMLGIPSEGFDMEEARVNESISHAAAEKLRKFRATNPTKEEYVALLENLRMSDGVDIEYPLTPDTVEVCAAEIQRGLPALRPHFRPGFRDAFLLEMRPRPNDVRGGDSGGPRPERAEALYGGRFPS